jgi:hypothetical protein
MEQVLRYGIEAAIGAEDIGSDAMSGQSDELTGQSKNPKKLFLRFIPIGKTDEFPQLKDLTRNECIKWGEAWICRSRRFADQNRLGALVIRPLAVFLTTLTGLVGVSASFARLGAWIGIPLAVLAAAAAGLSFVVAQSRPEQLYADDRLQQLHLSIELHYFMYNMYNIGRYKGLVSEDAACRVFVEQILKLTEQQVGAWQAQLKRILQDHPHARQATAPDDPMPPKGTPDVTA